MVWAGIKNNRKTNLIIINGNLNAQRYRDEILAPVVIPYVNANPNAIFQQDNACPHTARLTAQYLQANNVDVFEWPSKSPDLSPIEQVWDLLDDVYVNVLFSRRRYASSSMHWCKNGTTSQWMWLGGIYGQWDAAVAQWFSLLKDTRDTEML